MLGYNTKDPRKGSLLKLNDYLELVVPKKGGDIGPTLELEVRLPTSAVDCLLEYQSMGVLLMKCKMLVTALPVVTS